LRWARDNIDDVLAVPPSRRAGRLKRLAEGKHFVAFFHLICTIECWVMGGEAVRVRRGFVRDLVACALAGRRVDALRVEYELEAVRGRLRLGQRPGVDGDAADTYCWFRPAVSGAGLATTGN
jgi:hypothetical protein